MLTMCPRQKPDWSIKRGAASLLFGNRETLSAFSSTVERLAVTNLQLLQMAQSRNSWEVFLLYPAVCLALADKHISGDYTRIIPQPHVMGQPLQLHCLPIKMDSMVMWQIIYLLLLADPRTWLSISRILAPLSVSR